MFFLMKILYMYIFFCLYFFIKECLSVCKYAVNACYACVQYIYIKFKIHMNKCTSTNKISCFWIHKNMWLKTKLNYEQMKPI